MKIPNPTPTSSSMAKSFPFAQMHIKHKRISEPPIVTGWRLHHNEQTHCFHFVTVLHTVSANEGWASTLQNSFSFQWEIWSCFNIVRSCHSSEYFVILKVSNQSLRLYQASFHKDVAFVKVLTGLMCIVTVASIGLDSGCFREGLCILSAVWHVHQVTFIKQCSATRPSCTNITLL